LLTCKVLWCPHVQPRQLRTPGSCDTVRLGCHRRCRLGERSPCRYEPTQIHKISSCIKIIAMVVVTTLPPFGGGGTFFPHAPHSHVSHKLTLTKYRHVYHLPQTRSSLDNSCFLHAHVCATHAHAHTHASTYTYSYTCLHTHTCTHVYTCTHMHTYIHMHTYTHM